MPLSNPICCCLIPCQLRQSLHCLKMLTAPCQSLSTQSNVGLHCQLPVPIASFTSLYTSKWWLIAHLLHERETPPRSKGCWSAGSLTEFTLAKCLPHNAPGFRFLGPATIRSYYVLLGQISVHLRQYGSVDCFFVSAHPDIPTMFTRVSAG